MVNNEAHYLQLKLKNNQEPLWINRHMIVRKSDVSNPKWYLMRYKDAYSLMLEMISRYNNYKETLEWVRIVRASHYPPYQEHEVIYFQEF